MQRQLELTKAALKRKRATRPRGQRIPESEAQVQAAIIERLTLAGYTVVSTSRIRRGSRCRCGQWNVPAGGDGVTRGCPDLYVTHHAWPTAVWLGLEVKTATGRVSPEQRRLADDCRIVIVRNQDDAILAVESYELTEHNRTYGRFGH